jgi:PAS domain S-box-containing protein
MTPETELAEARRAVAEMAGQLEEARQAAARLAAIVEWSDDAMFSMSPDAVIQTWNPGAERLLGYTAAEITGRHARTFLFRRHAEHLAGFLERMAAGEASPARDVPCVRKDGSVVDVAFTCSVIRDPDGTVTGFSVVLRDITARLAAEAEIAAARAEREVAAERDRMARDLHDRVIQRVFAAGLALQAAASLARNPQATARIEAVVHDLDTTIDELRETIFTLRRRQRADAGLRYSILAIVEQTAAALGFSPEVTFQGPVNKVT